MISSCVQSNPNQTKCFNFKSKNEPSAALSHNTPRRTLHLLLIVFVNFEPCHDPYNYILMPTTRPCCDPTLDGMHLCSSHSNTRRPRRSSTEPTLLSLLDPADLLPERVHRRTVAVPSTSEPYIRVYRSSPSPSLDSACSPTTLLCLLPLSASRPSWKLFLSGRLLHPVAVLLQFFLFVTPLLFCCCTAGHHPPSNHVSWSPFSSAVRLSVLLCYSSFLLSMHKHLVRPPTAVLLSSHLPLFTVVQRALRVSLC